MDRMILAEAMSLHDTACREAYRRYLRCRSDLENAKDERERADEDRVRFVEYVKTIIKDPNA